MWNRGKLPRTKRSTSSRDFRYATVVCYDIGFGCTGAHLFLIWLTWVASRQFHGVSFHRAPRAFRSVVSVSRFRCVSRLSGEERESRPRVGNAKSSDDGRLRLRSRLTRIRRRQLGVSRSRRRFRAKSPCEVTAHRDSSSRSRASEAQWSEMPGPTIRRVPSYCLRIPSTPRDHRECRGTWRTITVTR